MTETELRCDVNPSKLLGKVQRPMVITDGNLIEIACDDCKRRHRAGGAQVERVLHRFDVTGELVETVVV